MVMQAPNGVMTHRKKECILVVRVSEAQGSTVSFAPALDNSQKKFYNRGIFTKRLERLIRSPAEETELMLRLVPCIFGFKYKTPAI
jgi:hypothetical protein